MGDKEDGVADLFMVVFDLVQDLVAALGIEAGGRLVENEDLWLHRDDPRDGGPPLLPARELEGAFFQKFGPQAGKFGGLCHPLADLLFPKAHVFGAEGDVLINGFLKELVLRVLEDQPDVETDLPHLAFIRPDILAVDEDPALSRL